MSKTYQQNKLNFDLSVTIDVGQTVSNGRDLYGTTLVAFITDANLSGVALTIQSSDSLTGTYNTVRSFSTGNNINGTVATSKYYVLAPAIDLEGVRFIKFVSGTTQATNPTVITLVTKASF